MGQESTNTHNQRRGGRIALLSVLAIPIGLLLLVLPMREPEVERLTRVVGLAIVLFAFTANAEYGAKKIVLAGAGALCVILWNLVPPDCPRCYKGWIRPMLGSRHIKFRDRTQIRVNVGNEDLLGTISRDQDRYTFVLPGNGEMTASKLVFDLTDPQPGEATSPAAQLAVLKDCVLQHIEKRGYVELYYDPERGLIFDDIVESERVLADMEGTASPSSCKTEQDAALFGYAKAGLRWLIALVRVGSAFAQTSPADGATLLLGELQSEDLRVRLRARESLQSHPDRAIPTVLALLEPTTPEASRLEAVYVLRDILRNNPAKRDSIIALLQQNDRKTLVEMLGAPSRAVRGGTASFLLELRDPAFIPMLERTVLANSIPWQPRYNAVLVLESMLGEMTSEQAADLKDRTNEMAGATEEVPLRELMEQFGKRRYFLVVTSFRDEARAVAQAQRLSKKEGFGEVQAHLLKTGLVAVTLPPTTLAGSFAVRELAERAAVAGPDAWLASDRQVVRQVYPPS